MSTCCTTSLPEPASTFGMVIGFDPVIAGATVQAGMIVGAEIVVTDAAIGGGGGG